MTRREVLLAVLGFSALALIWTYPLPLYLGDALPGLGDELLNMWILRWDTHSLRSGLSGWWDAPMFFPYKNAIAYSEHQLGTAMLVAPVQWMTGNPTATYNAALIGSYALAGFGMYLLAREVTLRRDAAVVAAAAFALAPYRSSQIAHLQVMMSGWMPIALWALTRYFRTRATWTLLVLSAAFTLQAFSNSYFLYYQVLPLAFVAVDGLRKAGREWPRRAAGLAAAAAVAALPLVPVALVYREVQSEQAFRRTLREVVGYSADVGSYLAAPPGNVWSRLPAFRKPEGALFPGATVMVLATVALWPRRPGLAGESSASQHSQPFAWRVGVPVAAAAFLLASIAAGYGGFPVLIASGVLLVRAVCPWPGTTAGLYAVIAFVAVVLSLGPAPTSWGRPWMPYGPYLGLYHTIPGFGGMRVASRLATIVTLALAVVAAFGARRLLLGRARTAQWALLMLMLAGIAVDGFRGPMPVVSLAGPGSGEVDQLAGWLRTRPRGAVLLLPYATTGVPQHFRMHQTHTMDVERPLVNGFRGHMPTLHRAFESEPSLLGDPRRIGRTMRVLHAVGVRYVVFDGRRFRREADVVSLVNATAAAVPVVERAAFGATRVIRLGASPSPVGLPPRRAAPIPASDLRVSAAPGAERASLAVDGDPLSRWLTNARQRGRERFSVRFDRPRDVAIVRLQMLPRSEGDYPRHLRIESIGDDGAAAVLFDDEVIEPLLAGLIREPRTGPIELALPPNRTAELVLRQTGRSRRQFWSINELILWER